jgi:hemoglobin
VVLVVRADEAHHRDVNHAFANELAGLPQGDVAPCPPHQLLEPNWKSAPSGITEEALGRLVGRFYERVRADSLLGPVFDGAIGDWPGHLDKLQAFWSSVVLTSGRYKGRPMAAHLRHADAVTPERFQRWLGLWRETAAELLAPEAAAAIQEKAERIAQSLQLGIALATGAHPLATSRPAPAVPAASSG